MFAKVHSVPSQTEGRRKALLKWKSLTYPLKYLLHVGEMLTIIKVFIILFLLVRIENTLEMFKRNQQALLSVECPGIQAKLKRSRKPFLEGARRGSIL